jgi:hypothetical protein
LWDVFCEFILVKIMGLDVIIRNTHNGICYGINQKAVFYTTKGGMGSITGWKRGGKSEMN